MPDKKIDAQFFSTVAEMHAIPDEKVDHFCEDLRSWLHMHRMADALGALVADAIRVQSPIDKFGWIDDGKHECNIRIHVTNEPPADTGRGA